MQDVPIDAADLPGYAARLYDWSLEHPRNIRLAIWQLLERGRRDGPPAASALATRHKIEVIAEAQAAGTVSSRIPAPELLGLILAMTHTAVLTFEPAATLDVTTRRAAAGRRGRGRPGARHALSRKHSERGVRAPRARERASRAGPSRASRARPA